VELYNPTDQDVDLSGWYFAYYSDQRDWSNPWRLKPFPEGAVIKSKDYYLIGLEGFPYPKSDWQIYTSAQMANVSGSVVIYPFNPKEKQIEELKANYIDAVGWGGPQYVKEGEAVIVPEAGKSIERYPGWPEGNNQDTNDNSFDFFIQEAPNPMSSRGGWLAGWEKRKLLVVDNIQNRSNLTDFEVNVTIDWEDGMNDNFSDIRFTDSDGLTLLNYGWDLKIEEEYEGYGKEDGVRAEAVVRVPEIPAQSEKIIYLYYGNSAVDPVADLSKVLTWFDDFTTDRSEEYESKGNLIWDTVNSYLNFEQIAEQKKGAFISLPLSIKNFILKTRVKFVSRNGKGNGYFGSVYRKTDENNFFALQTQTNFNDEPTLWQQELQGITTIKRKQIQKDALYRKRNVVIKTDEWSNLQIETYENEHDINWDDGFYWQGYIAGVGQKESDYEEGIDWEDVEYDLNNEGEIRIDGGRFGYRGATPIIDFIYVRKKTKPIPQVYEKGEGYSSQVVPSWPYPQFPGWEMRKTLVIDNLRNRNNLVDFAVDVEIDYQQKMNYDFSDIRFTDSDGMILLNHGWEIAENGGKDKTNGVRAQAVVKIPQIPTGEEKIIYMYYGNPSAAPAANLEKALTWFDHFDDYEIDKYKIIEDNRDDRIRWDTANSQVIFYWGRFLRTGISPKIEPLKDFILKMRVNSGGYGYPPSHFEPVYRMIDKDNFYQIQGGASEEGYSRTIWQKLIDGIKTEKKKENIEVDGQTHYPVMKPRTWGNVSIKAYESQHDIEWTGLYWHERTGSDFIKHDYQLHWQGIDQDLNKAGEIYIYAGRNDRRDAPPLLDYLYIRKNTKPFPTVREVEEGYQTEQLVYTAYPEFPNWERRKEIIIDYTSGDKKLLDYEIDVPINYEEEMNYDFSDIRFTDSDGSTLLDYGWEIKIDGSEKRINEQEAEAVVRVPEIPAGTEKIIYMYYGNPSAAPAADLEKTLTWFDDFTTNHSDVYDTEGDVRWDTLNSRLTFSGIGELNKISFKDFSIQDFVLKIKMKMQGGSSPRRTKFFLDYRKENEDNFYQLEGWAEIESQPYPPQWTETIDGFQSVNAQELVEDSRGKFRPVGLGRNKWIYIYLDAYQTRHEIIWTGFGYWGYVDGDYQFIDHNIYWVDEDTDLEQPGTVQFSSAKSGGSSTVIIDYVYIRKRAEITPEVNFSL